jgi:hypothetical protein
VKHRLLHLILLTIFAFGVGSFYWQPAADAAIDCTTYPTSLDGRCLNQAYFSGLDFGASITNGGYGSTGVFANAGAPNAGNLCAAFQNTDADITGPSQCGLWSYTDALGSDGLDKWAFPDTIDTGQPGSAQAFVNFIGDYLNYTEPGCNFNAEFVQPSYSIAGYGACDYYRARILGASYLVLTMVGGPYTTYDVGNLFAGQVNAATGPFNNVQAGIQDARNEFSTWSAEILQEDANGEVDWDSVTPPSVSFSDHPNTSSVDFDHDEEMRMEAPQTRHSIIFNTSSGQYVINRRCGNTDGFSVLPPPTDMNMQAYLGGIYDSTGAPATTLSPGGTYTATVATDNTGIASSGQVYLELKTPANTTNGPVDAVDGPYGVADGWSATNNCVAGYAMNPPGACTGPHWWWEYNNVAPASGQIWQTATFMVSAAAVGGSTICFQSDVVHEFSADPTSYALSPQICLTVASTRYPSVVGQNSDIHAGGGLCTGPQDALGFVLTNPNANSYDQYVVSASGLISNIGTNNSPTDSSLKIGSSGSYATVCRPDLYTYAEANQTGPLVGPGTYNIGTDPNFSGQAVFINGNATIHGNLNHKLTIVASGTVTIDNDINVTGGTSSADIPSLGVIAGGDIDIASAATHVDGYLFSDGTIDTCFPHVASCNTTLNINGFIMANNVSLSRTGPGSVGSQVGEAISMTPELYLNPPLYFDSGYDMGDKLQTLGEQPPLF